MSSAYALYGSDRSLLSPIADRLAARDLLKWVIAITASLGAILEVIDTSIVNVALPDIQGNLGATLSEAGWVSTGYACANVVMIPLTAWLGYRRWVVPAPNGRGYIIYHEPVTQDVYRTHVDERLRVTFHNGVVSMLEQTQTR